MLRCEVCKKEMKSVTNSHLRLHGLTTAEYKAQFPDAILSHRNGVTATEEYGLVPCLFTQNLLDANPEPSSPKSAMSVMYINMRNVVGEKVQRPGVEDPETNNTPVGVQNSSIPKRPAPIALEVTNV